MTRKSDASNMPNKPFCVKTLEILVLQSLFEKLILSPIPTDSFSVFRRNPFNIASTVLLMAGKDRGILLVVTSAEEVLVGSRSILMVHSLIIHLILKDKAFIDLYLKTAYISNQGVIPAIADFESTGGNDSIQKLFKLFCNRITTIREPSMMLSVCTKVGKHSIVPSCILFRVRKQV